LSSFAGLDIGARRPVEYHPSGGDDEQ